MGRLEKERLAKKSNNERAERDRECAIADAKRERKTLEKAKSLPSEKKKVTKEQATADAEAVRSNKAVMFMTREDSKTKNSTVVISEDDNDDDTTIALPTVNRNIASALSNSGARRAETSPLSARDTPLFKPAPLKERMTLAEAKAAGTKSYFQKDYESNGYEKAPANYEELQEEKRLIAEQNREDEDEEKESHGRDSREEEQEAF